jgi:flagellar basal-body rod protein FlgB
LVTDLTFDILEKDMGGLSRRLGATAQNLANADTPRYTRREVSFEDQLKAIIDGPERLPMTTTDPHHMTNLPRGVEDVLPRESRVGNEFYRYDENNVDPETEFARLAETRMSYQAMARIMGRKVAMYRSAIGGNG